MATMETDVALVHWPSDETTRRSLAERGVPRLLLVDQYAEPPVVVDHLEDWVRLPVTPADSQARVRALLQRTMRFSPITPIFDRSGALRYRSARIEISPVQRRLLQPLVDSFGTVVTREVLVSRAWSAQTPTTNALDVHLVRIRRRLAPHGLELRTIRSRGYLLDSSNEAQPG